MKKLCIFLCTKYIKDCLFYQRLIKSANNVFTVHPSSTFEQYYQKVFSSVSACTSRIRNREIDLEFKVWSPAQERDFKVLK